MAQPITALPDALVMGAGGTLGIAWLRGLIAGLEDASGLDLRRCDYFVGTSAGSYVAATLAAGRRVVEPGADPGRADDAAADALPAPKGPLKRLAGEGGRLAAAATAPFMPLALTATRPGGAAVRAAVLRAAPKPRNPPQDLRRNVEQLGARFDGRLRVVTVDRKRGSRVVFGAPGAPEAGVTEAVLASCAVPWIFSPVEIGGRDYVDGGVWSMSNLDVAPVGRGAEVLALLPIFGHGGPFRLAAQAGGLAELQVLRARGVRTRIVAPDAAATEAMGPDLMNARRRSSVFDAARAQGRSLAGV
jgi:NTE family protein